MIENVSDSSSCYSNIRSKLAILIAGPSCSNGGDIFGHVVYTFRFVSPHFESEEGSGSTGSSIDLMH